MCCASAEGPIEVNMTEVPIEEIELQLRNLGIQYGGHWKPKDCRPRWKVPFYYCIDDHKPNNDVRLTQISVTHIAILDTIWSTTLMSQINLYKCAEKG